MTEQELDRAKRNAVRNAIRSLHPNFPKIVCLCGSTKFWREYQRQMMRLTMEGHIYLSIGAATGTDDEHFGNLSCEEYAEVKTKLDELHKRKIDLADEVFVINCVIDVCGSCRAPCVGKNDKVYDPVAIGPDDVSRCCGAKLRSVPYVGESTRSEIEYALSKGKPVTYLNPPE
jgi:hypothetical protein